MGPDRQQEGVSRPAGGPIFEIDIPCPHCEYNLRGLIEARCPECGETFDPKELLETRPLVRPAGPGLLWALPRMLARPLAFWSSGRVMGSRGPGWGGLYWLLTVSILLSAMSYQVPRTVWQQRARIQPVLPALLKWRDADVVNMAAVLLVLPLWPLVFVLVHGIVCRVVLRLARVRDPDGAAKAVVVYSSIWTLGAMPALAGLLFWMSHQPVFNVGPWVHWVGLASLCLFVLAGICWARTLDAGGRSYAPARAWCGFWCAATNPFWYIAALLMFTAWRP
jgi:hypothetical protein